MTRKRFSAGQVKLFEHCQWQWVLNYDLGFPDDVTHPSAALGSASHHALELASRTSILKRPKSCKTWDFQYLWDISCPRYQDDYEGIDQKKFETIKNATFGLLDSRLNPYSEKIMAAEQEFMLNLPKCDFKGYIDRIDSIDEETIEIIDYKTGKRWDFYSGDEKNSSDLIKDIQPLSYVIAASEKYPNINNFLVTLHFLTDGGDITTFFTREDLPEIREKLVDRTDKILDNENPTRNKSWKCRFCAFNKNGLCEEIWQEKNQMGMDLVQLKWKALNDKS